MSDSRPVLRVSGAKPITKNGLGGIKMVSAANDRVSNNPVQAQDKSMDKSVHYYPQPAMKNSFARNTAFAFCFLASILWVAFCGSYVAFVQPLVLEPLAIAIFAAYTFVPAILLWLIYGVFAPRQQQFDYSQVIRTELQEIFQFSNNKNSILNKGMKDFFDKASEISVMSDSVIKSLSKAAQSVRHEIRDFSGVSKKAEFHMDRLTQNLQDKQEALTTLADTLEERVSNIGDTSQGGLDAWDNAVRTLIERSAEMKASLHAGASELVKAANDVSEQTQNIEHSMIETERLGGVIEGQVEKLEEGTERIVSAMTQSADTMTIHKEELDKSEQAITQRAQNIESALQSSIEDVNASIKRFNESVELSLEDTGTMKSQIEDKISDLQDAVREISAEADHIDNIGLSAASKITAAMASAVSGPESLNNSVQKAISMIEQLGQDSSEQANAIMSNATRQIEKIYKTGEENVIKLSSVVDEMSNAHEKMTKMPEVTQASVEIIANTLDTQGQKLETMTRQLNTRTEHAAETFENVLSKVNNSLNAVDTNHKVIEETLERRTQDLQLASDKATQNAEKIRDGLKQQTQEMSTLSGEMSGHIRSMTTQMDQQKQTVRDGVEESRLLMEATREDLGDSAHLLTELSQKAAEDIKFLKGEIQEECTEISQETESMMTKIANLNDTLGTQVQHIQARSGDSVAAIKEVNEKLERNAEVATPMLEAVLDKAETVQTRFDDLKEGYEISAQSNLERLQSMGIVFDERLRDLEQGSSKASAILDSTGKILDERRIQIEDTALSARTNVETLSEALREQSADVHLSTDQALLKIKSVQDEARDQFQEFSSSVGQAVAQLKGAGDSFLEQMSLVESKAEKADRVIAKSGQTARDQTTVFDQSVSDMSNNVKDMMRSMQAQMDDMMSSAKNYLATLKSSGDSYAMRAQEMKAHMDSSLQASESYGKEFKDQIKSIATASQYSTEAMGKAIGELTRNMSDVGEVANKVSNDIEASRRSLSSEAERLELVSAKVLQASQKSAQNFADQAEKLFRTSHEAASNVKKLKDSEYRTQRQGFMTSAKFVVESLHSLSVDVTRLMDGEISEKTWKAFQKGDVSAFTRKLVEGSGKWPLQKAQDKFARDSEFRNYVQRFIRQFEDMYAQATASDHSALLSSTIGSSEVAKLYDFLCGVSGQESCLAQMDRAA